MKPGMGRLLVGIAFLVAGIGVTMYSSQVFWWGAIVYGIIQIIRGGILLARSS
jgi:hypothetical protein